MARSRYRSMAERQIADCLSRYSIPFIYEKPTAVMDSGMLKLWYPDFTVYTGTIIEYFGVNGERAYEQRTRHKLRVYEANHLDVIAVFPNDLRDGWHDGLLDAIRQRLETPLQDFAARTSPLRRLLLGDRHRDPEL